ncbi:MAG TPA: ATP-dependent protease ATPase subunit HslU [Sphingobacteriaceae bacterium]|nr:ATP-dependent protease ATPase subunit HslU [Sphingobacteriaceae bacterium]
MPGEATELTPQQIVRELDKYIIGQEEAKRSVAVALRNRYRRRKLPPELRDEVVPKNILMIGPTGVGKTEIARRLAKLARAPFVKVEATKFTEVGYVGRDVEGMVRDLVETAVRMIKQERLEQVQDRARVLAEQRLLDLLAPLAKREKTPRNPFEALFGSGTGTGAEAGGDFEQRLADARLKRRQVEEQLAAGFLEDEMVEVEVEDNRPRVMDVLSGSGMEELSINLQDMFGGMFPRQKRRRRMPVREAREVLQQEEAHKLIDMDQVTAEAVQRAEQSGIIFIDEIDKIAGREQGAGPDVSREGVQRDILPIVEGSTVQTKYGPVRTDHMLFICAGAFHVSKPSDLIPELQGRFPIRVELEPLGKEEFRRILREPENALIKQYSALLATDGVELVFTPDGIDELADMAWRVNQQTENIGARRLHTLLEKVVEDVAFRAPEEVSGQVRIDAAYVRERLQDIVSDTDLSRYIL